MRVCRCVFQCLLLGVLSAGSLWAVPLPGACGDDSIRFEVKSNKGQPLPAAPATGMAQIIFIEALADGNGLTDGPVVRFGLDGAWAGATKATAHEADGTKFAYFVVSVKPGPHSVCADWQYVATAPSALVRQGTVWGPDGHVMEPEEVRANAGVDSLNAEAGKVYFYQFRLRILPYDTGIGLNKKRVEGAFVPDLRFQRLTEADALATVRAAPLCTSKPGR
jgi:hypothetical protein